MANMHDYLRWRGDLSFGERPFNDVDNLVLSTLCYLDFAGIVPGEWERGGISLAHACQRLLDKAGNDISPYVRSLAQVDASFVQLMAWSRRFGSATLRAYVDEVDDARALQFSALQVDLPDAGTYVAFRGTDSTLVGWREDFITSFQVTEAQHEARRYLERAIERVGDHPVMVGGHSKGGNLAEYAATRCVDGLRWRITRVYTNDGPGMAPEVMRADSREVLGRRLVRIVPSYSVVGMLFAREGDKRTIALSSGTGIGQHDPTTWQVTAVGFEEQADLLPDCKVVNQAIASWAEGLSLDERAEVTKEVFDALGAGGARTFAEVTASPESLQKVLAALDSCDEQTRRVARALVDSVIDTSVDAATRAMREVVDQWRKSAHQAAGDAARRLFGQDRTITIDPRHALPK